MQRTSHLRTSPSQKTLFLLGMLASIQTVQTLSMEGQIPPRHDPHFRVEQNHYLDFPVMRKDFENWRTVGAAVIMKNRGVIAPETIDKKGIIYSTKPNPLVNDWMLDIEVDIGNEQRSQKGGTGLGIFYLRSINEVSHTDSIFGYSSRFEGVGIYMNSLLKSEKGNGKEILNAIQGYYNDGQRIVNVFSDKKHMCYKRYRNLPGGQTTKLRIQYDSPLLSVSYYDASSDTFELCFSFEVDLNYQGYFLLSGASGAHKPDHIYLHSIKLFDPKTVASNEHFQEARHSKAQHEVETKLKEAVKDLFEKHSLQDTFKNMGKASNGTDRNIKDLIDVVPAQHNHLQHKLQQIIIDTDIVNSRFFELMRGMPSLAKYDELNQRLINYRMTVEALNQNLEQEASKLRNFDKKLKQVRHTVNIQKGLQQREVSNQYTRQLFSDIQSVEQKLMQIAALTREYQQTVEELASKIRREAGFANKLEEKRKVFAAEQSDKIQYDLRDIDRIFDEMETDHIQTGGGMGTMALNLGMVLVILTSIMLWIKMSKYESKNS